jgi:hypothetical protein
MAGVTLAQHFWGGVAYVLAQQKIRFDYDERGRTRARTVATISDIGLPDPMAALFSRDVRFRQTRFAINRVTRSGILELHVEPSVLPKSVDGGNLGCNKLFIRWLPV